MSASESKLFTTLTLDNIRDVLHPLRKANIPFYIITAESGYCPACHSDLSSANITAPNSLLGHLRRSKKCIAKRDERNVRLFGLKQPDSLLWGSVDDITALDSRKFPDKNLWFQSVFPPTRPQMNTPMYASISQWHARTESGDGYSSASPPPSSSSSDDGWSGSTSSSGSSPSSAHFPNQGYAMMPQNAFYDRRESAATITPSDYYGQKGAAPAMYPQGFPATVPMTTGTMPPQPQYRMQQQVPYGQPMPQGVYGQLAGYQYPQQPQQPAPGYSW